VIFLIISVLAFSKCRLSVFVKFPKGWDDEPTYNILDKCLLSLIRVGHCKFYIEMLRVGCELRNK
jgi:hypothetical protein